MIPFLLIASVVSVILMPFVPDPDYDQQYKVAAAAERISWKEPYVFDYVRYDSDLHRASISSTISMFFREETETRTVIVIDYNETPPKEIEVQEEVTIRVPISLDEVMEKEGFSQEQKTFATELLMNLIDIDSYGSDDQEALPGTTRSLIELVASRYGIEWHVMGGIWKGSGQNITLPDTIWQQYQQDGDNDGRADPWQQMDVFYTLANYLKSVDYKSNLRRAIGGLYPGQEDHYLREIELIKGHSDIGNAQLKIWPVPDYRRITSGFGTRIDPIDGIEKGHKGVDFGAPSGSQIVAVAAGEVISTIKEADSGGYGLLTIIEDKKTKMQYWYAHQSKFAVSPGMLVDAGDLIGYVGSTGKSTGPHLHLEIRVNGKAVNPIPYLQ